MERAGILPKSLDRPVSVEPPVPAGRAGVEPRGTPDTIEEAGTAPRYPVAVNHPGGWSQRHYQRHAVENWARSAREVADAVAALADRVGPEVILVGGDPTSVGLLRHALPKELDERVEEVSASRAAT